MSVAKPYDVVTIQPEDGQRVIKFLRKFFFRDEPLNLWIGLLDDQPTCEELETYCLEPLHQGVSLMAVSPTNDILGVCINGILSKDDTEEEDAECKDKKFQTIINLIDRVSKESNVLGRFPDVDKAIDIKVASVDEAQRGRGIARALFDATRKMAKAKGFPLVKVVCTSHFTALAVTKLGFNCIHTLQYDDHLGEDGKPVFIHQLPHSSVKTFVIRL